MTFFAARSVLEFNSQRTLYAVIYKFAAFDIALPEQYLTNCLFILDAGTSTTSCFAVRPLRMRVSISATESVTGILFPPCFVLVVKANGVQVPLLSAAALPPPQFAAPARAIITLPARFFLTPESDCVCSSLEANAANAVFSQHGVRPAANTASRVITVENFEPLLPL